MYLAPQLKGDIHNIYGTMIFVVYFDQLLDAGRTWELIKTLFQLFSTFFLLFNIFQWISIWNHWKTLKTQFFQTFLNVFKWFQTEIHWKCLKRRNTVENGWKKVFWPAFGCAQHLKAGWNTQQILDWDQNKACLDLDRSCYCFTGMDFEVWIGWWSCLLCWWRQHLWSEAFFRGKYYLGCTF